MKEKHNYLALIAFTLALLTAVFLLVAQTALADRPPQLPTTPAPQPKPTGVAVELRALFDPSWSWTDVPAQALGTVMQPPGDQDGWHDVEGALPIST